MKIWSTLALAGLLVISTSEQVWGQARTSVGPRWQGQASGRGGRPSSPRRPNGGPSRPSSPSVYFPFRSTMVFAPAPRAGSHRPLAFRSAWLGLVFFDPAWLWAPSMDGSFFVPEPPPEDTRPLGGLQLDVLPRQALVYVDGWYVGVVDDFSGYYRHLEAGAGLHVIEIVAPDYEPLMIEVTLSPGRTTTYRGSLSRAPGRD